MENISLSEYVAHTLSAEIKGQINALDAQITNLEQKVTSKKKRLLNL